MTATRMRHVEFVAADLVEALAGQRFDDARVVVEAAEHAGLARALLLTLAALLAVQEDAEATVAVWRDGGVPESSP